MDETEKRGRHNNVVARRQQQQQQQQLQQHASSFSASLISTALPFNNKISQQWTKRKLSDHSIALPQHLDFSFRDHSDAAAKRRFQVKVPCRLLAVLLLVFLIVPGLIFLQKEMHIHEDHYESHYKTEKYVNVKTEEVFSVWKFRMATINQTTMVQDDEENYSTDTSSILVIPTSTETVVANNTNNNRDVNHAHVENNKNAQDFTTEVSKFENSTASQNQKHIDQDIFLSLKGKSFPNATETEESSKINDNNIKVTTNSTNKRYER